MARNRRVFPFFLDGGVQAETIVSLSSWNGKSSYVELTKTGFAPATFSVGMTDSNGKPIDHGTMLVVKKVGGEEDSPTQDKITVDWSDEISSSLRGGSADLLANGESVLLMFKSPTSTNKKGEWVNLSSDDQDLTLVAAELTNVSLKGTISLATNNLSAVAAAGSDASDATQIVATGKPVHRVSSSADTEGIKFSAAESNFEITVINTSATAVKIYPSDSIYTEINGSASAYTLAANTAVKLFFNGGTNGDNTIYTL